MNEKLKATRDKAIAGALEQAVRERIREIFKSQDQEGWPRFVDFSERRDDSCLCCGAATTKLWSWAVPRPIAWYANIGVEQPDPKPMRWEDVYHMPMCNKECYDMWVEKNAVAYS